MQKGQITIFMLIGLIILIIFGGLIYIRNSSANTKLEIMGQQMSQQEMLSARYYAEEITRQTLLDGLWLMGRQGGKLYKDQGGLSEYTKQSWIENDDNRIATGIAETEREENAYPDSCPLGGGKCYFYGKMGDMPTLQDMEKQLNEYMKNNLPKNLDFRDAKDYNMIKKEVKNASVKINQQDITATAEYDIIAERKGVQGQIKTVKAQAKLNLNNLYYFNGYIIKKDITDLNFDIQQDGSNTEYNQRKYTVTRKEGEKYDIITAEDDTIAHNGKAFQYKWIRQNRAPDASRIRFDGYSIYDGTAFTAYRTITQYPDDPDEDHKAKYDLKEQFRAYAYYDWLNWKGKPNAMEGSITTCGNPEKESKPFSPAEYGATAEDVCGQGPLAKVNDSQTLTDTYRIPDNNIRCSNTIHPECCDGNPGCWKRGGKCNGEPTFYTDKTAKTWTWYFEQDGTCRTAECRERTYYYKSCGPNGECIENPRDEYRIRTEQLDRCGEDDTRC